METPLKLLLIEDSPADALLLTRELSKGGYAPLVTRVETAEAMLAELETDQWDLIISDYRMPLFSGPDALALLKKQGIDLPFIIVSGTIGEVNAVDAMLAGANDYVMKNNMTRLVPAIRREIADAHSRAAHREAEAALFESEERFRNMADSAPVLLWVSDTAGNLVYVNKKWLDFTGRTMQAELDATRVNLVHPGDLAIFQSTYLAAMAHRGGFQLEYRMRKRDGQWRTMLDTGSPRYLKNGAFAGYIGTCLDLTERKNAEQENYRLLQEREKVAIQQKTFVRDILYSVTDGKLRVCDNEAGLPPATRPQCEPIPLTTESGIRALRYTAVDAMEERGYDRARWYDMATAIGEAGMNAVVHAGGGKGQIFSSANTVQAWISDHGVGIDLEALPKATLQKGYTTAGTLGHGMKMMLGMVDRLWLLTQPTGTTVVLEQDREPSLPIWA